MPSPVLNLGAFTTAELTSMLAAAKVEYLARMSKGRVKGGGSAAQQYQMDVMTVDQLTELINSLTGQLGLDNPNIRARPNFNPNGVVPLPGVNFGA